MKHMKKMLALALVVMSVMAIAVTATADEVWSDRYGDIELYRNSGYYRHIMNLQRDLNSFGDFHLEVDGYFGDYTEMAVKIFQGVMGLEQDGRVGPLTKTALWNFLF